MLTFENSPVQGAAAITEKLVSLPFAKVQHEVTSLDAQPSNEANGILVLVSGRLLVCTDSANPFMCIMHSHLRTSSGSLRVLPRRGVADDQHRSTRSRGPCPTRRRSSFCLTVLAATLSSTTSSASSTPPHKQVATIECRDRAWTQRGVRRRERIQP